MKLTALAVIVLASPAWAGSNTDRELAELADDIRKVLAFNGTNELSLAGFRNPRDDSAAQGAGIAQTLRVEFQKRKVVVKDGAKFRLGGEFQDKEDPRSGRVFIELTAKLIRVSDEKVVKTSVRGIFGIGPMVTFLGPPALVLNPAATEEAREKSAIDQIDDPKPPTVRKSQVFHDGEKTYGVELLVRKGEGFEPREVVLVEGQPFVELHRGEEFVLRLINNSAHEAAVELTIDGINTFAFCELKGSPKHWIVPAKDTAVVFGWAIKDGHTDSFQLTEYAKSAVGMLPSGSPAQVGVITASFRAAWKVGSKPPADEGEHAGRGTDAIGRGSMQKTPLKPVRRTFGVERGAVSIRYDKP